jgi:hypothetical protein
MCFDRFETTIQIKMTDPCEYILNIYTAGFIFVFFSTVKESINERLRMTQHNTLFTGLKTSLISIFYGLAFGFIWPIKLYLVFR